MPRRIGPDIDGVLCKEKKAQGPQGCAEVERSDLPLPASGNPELYIISFRTEDTREETERWPKENGVEYDMLILNGRDPSGVGRVSKAEIDGEQAGFKAG